MKIDTRNRRNKLIPRKARYWQKVTTGRYIGFYRTENGGTWHARMLNEAKKRVFTQLDGDIDNDYSDVLKQAMNWFENAQGVANHRYTVQMAVDDYVKHLEIVKTERAARETKQRLKKHLTSKFGTVELAKLTTKQVKAVRDGMVKKLKNPDKDNLEDIRKSKDSANRVMNMVKAAFNLAYQEGMVASDDAWKRVKSFQEVGANRQLFLTDKQITALLNNTKGGFHNLVEVAVLTGARYGELCSAKVKDFDQEAGTLTLSGKTKPHLVYLSDKVVKVLKRITRNSLPTAHLLMKDDGTSWGRGHQQRRMIEAVQVANLPPETVFYSLRHYHISKALIAGIPIQMVAENCGTSVRMIEKHYGKFLKTSRREMFNMVVLG